MAAVSEDDTVAVLWKGEHQPVPLVEQFQTGDLQATISTCRTLIEDTIGVPLTGIVDQKERTATEIQLAIYDLNAPLVDDVSK